MSPHEDQTASSRSASGRSHAGRSNSGGPGAGRHDGTRSHTGRSDTGRGDNSIPDSGITGRERAPTDTVPEQLAPGARLHIFDVDHTLTYRSTGALFARAARELEMVTLLRLASLPFLYLRYRMGYLSLGAVTKQIKPLQGFTREALREPAYRAWENGGRENVFPDAAAYLGECRTTGAEIAVATSTFDVILDPLKEELGVDYTISSVLDFDAQGLSTGWLQEGPCYAEEKARRMLALLAELKIPPEECAFYSDSFHDLPGLRVVGMPVAVNPDFLLRRVARREGWPIVHWRRGVASQGSEQRHTDG